MGNNVALRRQQRQRQRQLDCTHVHEARRKTDCFTACRIEGLARGRSPRHRTLHEGILFCPTRTRGRAQRIQPQQRNSSTLSETWADSSFTGRAPSIVLCRRTLGKPGLLSPSPGFWQARFNAQRLILAPFYKLETSKRTQGLPAIPARMSFRPE